MGKENDTNCWKSYWENWAERLQQCLHPVPREGTEDEMETWVRQHPACTINIPKSVSAAIEAPVGGAGHFMGFPVFVNPFMPEDEIWLVETLCGSQSVFDRSPHILRLKNVGKETT